jgi:hypothetical protein
MNLSTALTSPLPKGRRVGHRIVFFSTLGVGWVSPTPLPELVMITVVVVAPIQLIASWSFNEPHPPEIWPAVTVPTFG